MLGIIGVVVFLQQHKNIVTEQIIQFVPMRQQKMLVVVLVCFCFQRCVKNIVGKNCFLRSFAFFVPRQTERSVESLVFFVFADTKNPTKKPTRNPTRQPTRKPTKKPTKNG